MASRVLKFLTAVTYSVADLITTETAWRDHLGFRTVDSGTIADELSEAWGAPASARQPYCLMQPESGAEVYLRFVETGEPYPFGPPGHFGWCATEFLVRDPDALARRLEHSPFRRIAGPGDLFPRPRAPRAMQVLGPGDEIVYFTRILPGGSQYGMKGAQSDVDRPFIVPVGGPSLEAMQAFYCDTLGLRRLEPLAFINPIIAQTCGAPPSTIIPTAIAPLPGRRFLLEMDELPPTAVRRPRRDGHLPPGMAMVSFLTDDLDTFEAEFRSTPAPLQGAPYDGRRVAVITGPAGEWLELIEDKSARADG
ncbi:MAG: VOC family protein [Gammaproteobacteria bacterium]|nr:VOC family protein [Gammaproteobacteria bacterium]